MECDKTDRIPKLLGYPESQTPEYLPKNPNCMDGFEPDIHGKLMYIFPSVLRCCRVSHRKDIRPVKNQQIPFGRSIWGRAYPRIIYENKTRSPCMSGRFMLQVWNYKRKHYVIEKQPYTQLHLGLDHTKFTQDRPPVQSDTVPSCNMAFLTTRTGLPTVNIRPSHFTHVGDFNY